MIEENVLYAPPKEEGGGGRIDNQGRSPAARRASPDAEDWSEAGKARGRSKSGCDQSDPRLGEQGDWVACGLVWKAPLTEMPSGGIELVNEKLAAALSSKTEFTQEEWDAFGIDELCSDHFVRVGDVYFHPAQVYVRYVVRGWG